MCQTVHTNWIKSIVLTVLFKVTLGEDKPNQLNETLLTVHPWLPIGNFTGIIINGNSVNQSYYSYNYVYNVTSTLNHYQHSDNDEPDNTGDTMYQRINLNNYSESDNDSVNLSPSANFNPDESSFSFLDDSPTKEEDYAGGNYGNDDDLLSSDLGNGNFASQEDDEGLT